MLYTALIVQTIGKCYHLFDHDKSNSQASCHFCSIHCVSLGGPSMLYACGCADSSIHVWSRLPSVSDTPSLSSHMIKTELMRLPHDDHCTLRGHSGPVYGTCFNATGQFLLSASEDNTIRLWDLQKHTCAVCYRGHTYPVWDVAFRYIVAGAEFSSFSF